MDQQEQRDRVATRDRLERVPTQEQRGRVVTRDRLERVPTQEQRGIMDQQVLMEPR